MDMGMILGWWLESRRGWLWSALRVDGGVGNVFASADGKGEGDGGRCRVVTASGSSDETARMRERMLLSFVTLAFLQRSWCTGWMLALGR